MRGGSRRSAGYLAIDPANTGAFADADDLLLDITGVTGTIATGNFVDAALSLGLSSPGPDQVGTKA